MKPVTQTRTGAVGTCFRAALASILELPERAVPDFKDANLDPEVNQFLAKRGLRYVEVPIGGAPPVGWHIITGTSPRGGQHAVVGKDGRIVHDPHPPDGTGRGLVERKEYGLLLPVARANDEAVHVVRAGFTKSKSGHWTVTVAYSNGAKYTVGKLPHLQRAKEVAEQLRALPYEERRSIAYDRADMMALRRNTMRQGGPFHVQLTEPDGREHTTSVHALRAYDVANWEYVLWGLPKGSNDRIDEKVLSAGHQDKARIDKIKTLAAKDGWHSFRLIKLNLMQKPDFTKGIKDEVQPIPPFNVGNSIRLRNGKKSTVAKITLARNLLDEPEWHVLTASGDVLTIKLGSKEK